MVGVKIFADLDVPPVIAPEGRGDAEPLPRAAQQPADERLLLLRAGGRQLVVGETQVLAAGPLRQQFRVVVRVVKQAPAHFLSFGHSVGSFLSTAVQYIPMR